MIERAIGSRKDSRTTELVAFKKINRRLTCDISGSRLRNSFSLLYHSSRTVSESEAILHIYKMQTF